MTKKRDAVTASLFLHTYLYHLYLCLLPILNCLLAQYPPKYFRKNHSTLTRSSRVQNRNLRLIIAS